MALVALRVYISALLTSEDLYVAVPCAYLSHTKCVFWQQLHPSHLLLPLPSDLPCAGFCLLIFQLRAVSLPWEAPPPLPLQARSVCRDSVLLLPPPSDRGCNKGWQDPFTTSQYAGCPAHPEGQTPER